MKKIIIDVDAAISKHNEKSDKKLNREKLSKKLGLSYQSVMNYQLGRVPVILETLIKISKITGTSIDELIKEIKEN